MSSLHDWRTQPLQRTIRQEQSFDLLDTGVFDEDRYWDVEVSHAKKGPKDIMTRIKITKRGSDRAESTPISRKAGSCRKRAGWPMS